MTRIQIIQLQEHVGTKADGFWGPMSIAACQKHLWALMAKCPPRPRPDADSLRRAFGAPGDESQLVRCQVGDLGVEYEGTPVSVIRCNKLVEESLFKALAEIAAGPHKDILRQYAGCFNFRRKRGGSSYSLHAYGAAIDLDPDNNAFRDSWPMRSNMPIGVMEAFARQGFKSGAAFWGYDAMHFEFTS